MTSNHTVWSHEVVRDGIASLRVHHYRVGYRRDDKKVQHELLLPQG